MILPLAPHYHGTTNGYTHYGCRCDECRTANTDYARTAKYRNASSITGTEHWHGTENGYSNHACRCTRCRRAHREHFRAAMTQRAERAQCSVDGCVGGQYAVGLCKAHYERTRDGRPLDTPIIRRPNGAGRKPGKDMWPS